MNRAKFSPRRTYALGRILWLGEGVAHTKMRMPLGNCAGASSRLVVRAAVTSCLGVVNLLKQVDYITRLSDLGCQSTLKESFPRIIVGSRYGNRCGLLFAKRLQSHDAV